ncbi:sigma-54 dependent transcriptional regulator [bacterium]|nr:sigma-54 dependent transcriptional regulator [bacterium]
MKTLLILDDEVLALEAMQIAMGSKYKLLLASSFQKAVQILENEDIDGAMIDINLQGSDRDGIEFLSLFKKRYAEKPALIVSGYREVPTVVRCMKLGADDYLEKPFDRETVEMKIDKIFAGALRTRVYQRAFEKSAADQQIIGRDAGILRAKKQIEEAASLRVLMVGETGVGKTPFARYSNSVVSDATGQARPFEQLNCACLNTEQFQDQLFGHKKGAFTGAITDKRGLVELARGGDLFLDEIGEMPLETQAMFLTFLDSQEYYRLGDDVKRKADVRIISATNRNLKKMVEEGKFRKDLYSRISQVVVNIPPLRERPSDIPLLLEHFIEKFAGHAKAFNPEVLTTLREQTWEEGNVREFQDAVEFLCLRSRGSEQIELEHLPSAYSSPAPASVEAAVSLPPSAGEDFRRVLELGLESYLDAYERQILQSCIERYSGTLDEMARELKVSRPTLYRRLKRHRIGTREEVLH